MKGFVRRHVFYRKGDHRTGLKNIDSKVKILQTLNSTRSTGMALIGTLSEQDQPIESQSKKAGGPGRI